MSIPVYSTDTNVIQKLDDRPNDTGGLSASALKAKFDEGSGDIKTYINDVLLPFLESASAAGNLGVDTITGIVADTIQEALEAIVQSMQDITQGSVADGSITEAKLAAGAVTGAKLANSAVDGSKLADGSVGSGKIAALAVTTAKIAMLAITTALIADGAVTADKIANSGVTTAKIANAAVDNTKLAEAAVTAVKIAAGAVSSTKLADGAVTAAKQGFVKFGTAEPTTAHIAEGEIYLKYEA